MNNRRPVQSIPSRGLLVLPDAARIDTRTGTVEPLPMRNAHGFPVHERRRWVDSAFLDTEPHMPDEVVAAWLSLADDPAPRRGRAHPLLLGVAALAAALLLLWLGLSLGFHLYPTR